MTTFQENIVLDRYNISLKFNESAIIPANESKCRKIQISLFTCESEWNYKGNKMKRYTGRVVLYCVQEQHKNESKRGR
jgi:hypothetical protein